MAVVARKHRLWVCIVALFVADAAAADGTPPTGGKQREKSMESAKRRAPQAKPVVHKGVRYEQVRDARAQGFQQSGGVVAAVDVATGKQLWVVQVYKVTYDRNEEKDAQEIYIEELRIDRKANALLAHDERGRRFSIDLKDGTVKEQR